MIARNTISFLIRPSPDMRMPVLADIRKTQQELTLALAELDSIEAAVVAQGSSQHQPDASQLKERVEFLQQENRELAQVVAQHWITVALTNLSSFREMMRFSSDSIRFTQKKKN